MEMNSLPRWLISITDMPVPRQSSISSPARAMTSAGSMAGPALKLKILDMLLMNGWRRLRGRLVAVQVARCRAVVRTAIAVAAVPIASEIPLLDALEAGEL